MIVLKNGKIYCMNDTTIENGYIIVENGKIKEVGSGTPPFFSFSEEYDCEGGYVFPGFIDAHCHIGIIEETIGTEGDDVNEVTDPITPHLRAIDAINPMDLAFADAVQAGVTCVMTGPGSANVIGGQFAVIKTYGRRIDDMIVKQPAAMKEAFGENPKNSYNEKRQSPMTRMATAALLREFLFKAQEYKLRWDEYNQNTEENEKPEFDFKLDSLLEVLRGNIPLKAHAHRADDILTAIRICKEFGLKLTLDHCTEGHLIADIIKLENVPAIVGPTLVDRPKIELKNLTFKTPGILTKEGIKVAIMTDHPCTPIQYIPICAALSVKHGMDEYEALKAITINPAEILGISDRLGSIESGKDADISVFNLHPFDYKASAKMVMIDGIMVYRLNNV